MPINPTAAAASTYAATQPDGTAANSAASSSSASITANDFLQLLVTEMKNQDPTSNMDPNEYINQLVQVNSLEQLVQINQDLGGSSSASNTGSTTWTAQSGASAQPGTAGRPASAVAHGNLGGGHPVGSMNAAATRVAGSLSAAGTPATPAPANTTAQPAGTPFDAIVEAIRSHAPAATTPTSSPAR